MATVIDLEHIKRARRLLAICIKQFGPDHYFIDDAFIPRIDGLSVEDTVQLARSWIAKRTAREVSDATLDVFRDMLKKHLVRYVTQLATGRGL